MSSTSVPTSSREELTEKLARYERILRWYANSDRYLPRFEGVGKVGLGPKYLPQVEADLGQLARDALGINTPSTELDTKITRRILDDLRQRPEKRTPMASFAEDIQQDIDREILGESFVAPIQGEVRPPEVPTIDNTNCTCGEAQTQEKGRHDPECPRHILDICFDDKCPVHILVSPEACAYCMTPATHKTEDGVWLCGSSYCGNKWREDI